LDDLGEVGFVVWFLYFDCMLYVEEGVDGLVVYVEYYWMLGDWVCELVVVGFVVEDLVELEWLVFND